MNEEMREFGTAFESALADLLTAINEAAEVCESQELKEKMFAIKRCVGRVGAAYMGRKESPSLQGEPAPEFAGGSGEVPRIKDL